MTSHHETEYFKSHLPVHRTSYCAFLDILGFSDRITESFNKNKGDDLLQQFHAIFSKQVIAMKKVTEDSLLYFKSFTDNIVLAHPRFSQDLESEFAFVLWSLSAYQYEMALQGFFIRGGLAIGDLFIDDNSIYGPALLEAHDLESKVAVNPIVVLSNSVMGLVIHHHGFYSGEGSPQNRDVLVGSDGRFFINYLTECFIDTGYSEEVNWDGLNAHKAQIETALVLYAHLPRVFDKFTWLAEYHNYFCESAKGYKGYKPSIKIKKNLASRTFYKISEVIKNDS